MVGEGLSQSILPYTLGYVWPEIFRWHFKINDLSQSLHVPPCLDALIRFKFNSLRADAVCIESLGSALPALIGFKCEIASRTVTSFQPHCSGVKISIGPIFEASRTRRLRDCGTPYFEQSIIWVVIL